MLFDFDTDELRELYETGACRRLRLHHDVIVAFFTVMQRIRTAQNERYLRYYKGLRMEKLRGHREGQYSVRLNDQYRLIFTIEGDITGSYLLIIEIVDYH